MPYYLETGLITGRITEIIYYFTGWNRDKPNIPLFPKGRRPVLNEANYEHLYPCAMTTVILSSPPKPSATAIRTDLSFSSFIRYRSSLIFLTNPIWVIPKNFLVFSVIFKNSLLSECYRPRRIPLFSSSLIIRMCTKAAKTAVLFMAQARIIQTIGHANIYSQFPSICFELIHQPFERLLIFIRLFQRLPDMIHAE